MVAAVSRGRGRAEKKVKGMEEVRGWTNRPGAPLVCESAVTHVPAGGASANFQPCVVCHHSSNKKRRS